ncbi:MAG TPA: DUF6166 domain-containing protein [Gemmatimonadales bacterium]|nr:DUF6166 domain-containing protein [Gemmatimonadales bacterium]
MTTYTGERSRSRIVVRADGNPLCPRFDLRVHSPSGFNWGYAGSGPAQLALAILADHLPSDENRALASYQQFKNRVIARLEGERWALTSRDVAEALAGIEADALAEA